MKAPLKSRTIRVAMSVIVASLVTVIMHFTGSLEVSPQVLGGAWSGLLSSALMIYMRFITSTPVGKDEVSKEEGEPK